MIITEDNIARKPWLPDELLEGSNHSLGLGRDVGGLGWPHHGAGAPLVLPQAEPDSLVLAVCAHRDQELALVSVFRLQAHKKQNTALDGIYVGLEMKKGFIAEININMQGIILQ